MIVKKIKSLLKRYGVLRPKKNSKSVPISKSYWKEIISQDEAIGAIESVGRVKRNAFTPFPRPVNSSDQMNELENRWWNKAGHLIEKVWVLPEEICVEYRKIYVERAAAFFLKNSNTARILDLGCGSGWFGRMIVRENIEYTGIDFSKTQIDIANEKMSNHQYRNKLTFLCLDDLKDVPNLEQINCVIINAFLHHLYWKELDDLFSSLMHTLPKDCKFYILEPIYPARVKSLGSTMSKDTVKHIVEGFRQMLSHLKKSLVSERLFDQETEDQLDNLMAESNRNGFFLSPKEVPFPFEEFVSFVSKYLEVIDHYQIGILDLETSQFLAKIKEDELRHQLTKSLLPQAKLIDELLLKNGYTSHYSNDYLFTAFECVLK